ncbi:MAG: metallophosphoesterase [Tissierellia bacterium]|nr:metallophosphoesterase [Tissierellia bacterium]
MKFLFFTDTHIKNHGFENRKDDYVESLKMKFEEIKEIGIEEEVDYYLHGGDLLDRPDISLKTAGEFGQILQSFPKPIYGISGNHDIFGHNPNTVSRSVLGLYHSFSIVELIHWEKPLILEDGDLRIQISGSPYRYDIDGKDHSRYYPQREENVDIHILMIHSFLLDKKFIDNIPYTLIEDIMDTDADIVLAGHYHTGFGVKKLNKKYFINPGAVVRISRSTPEFDRIPKVALLELNKKEWKISLRDLKTARPGHEILKKIDRSRDVNKDKMEEFKKLIRQSSDLKGYKILEILKEISTKEKIEASILEEAIRRLEE